MKKMRTYLKVDVVTHEIYAHCTATSREQAMRKMDVWEGNKHLYEVFAESRYYPLNDPAFEANR